MPKNPKETLPKLCLAGQIERPVNEPKKQKEAAPEGRVDRSFDRQAETPKKTKETLPKLCLADRIDRPVNKQKKEAALIDWTAKTPKETKGNLAEAVLG